MSWLFSQVLVEEYSGESSSGGEPSAPLNLMPTPQPFLLKDKTTAFSGRSQFGLTLRHLTADRGAALLMSFLAAFPARISAPLAKVPESRDTDLVCGWKWPASFAKYDPVSRLWRTRQCSLLGGLDVYSETWPRWGSMRDGECSVPPMPARRTGESESGLWPTIRSTDADRGGRGDLIQAIRGNENSHYRLWQTPVADDAVDRAHGKLNSRGEMKLSAQVKRWPTPHGFSKDGKSNGPSGNELGRAVNQTLWPTPTAVTNTGGAAITPEELNGSLNPTWVEWLMGWPTGWSDCVRLGMDKFLAWQQWHGKR